MSDVQHVSQQVVLNDICTTEQILLWSDMINIGSLREHKNSCCKLLNLELSVVVFKFLLWSLKGAVKLSRAALVSACKLKSFSFCNQSFSVVH